MEGSDIVNLGSCGCWVSKVAVGGLEPPPGWGCDLSKQLKFLQIWLWISVYACPKSPKTQLRCLCRPILPQIFFRWLITDKQMKDELQYVASPSLMNIWTVGSGQLNLIENRNNDLTMAISIYLLCGLQVAIIGYEWCLKSANQVYADAQLTHGYDYQDG